MLQHTTTLHTPLLMEPQASVALVVGVTGMTGLSLVEALKQPNCLGGPWKVYGAARRPPPSWFPTSIIDHFITFDAVDSADTRAKLFPIAHEVTHLFWVTLQVGVDEEANITVNKTMLLNVLNTLKSSRLAHVTVQTGTKHYMGPVFDPVRSTQLICHENMPRLPYPNLCYALEDVVESYAPSLTYTWEHFFDMTDAGVLAQQHVWALSMGTSHATGMGQGSTSTSA